MIGSLRLLLVWLIAVAIPVQGFAAHSMIDCRSSSHSMGTHSMHSDAHRHVAADRHEAHHAMVALPCEHHDSAHVDKSPQSGKASCCGSAACGVSAGIVPSSAELALASDASAVMHPAHEAAIVSVSPSGLERPPRIHLV